MKDKTFEFIKHSIEDAQELFYGQTMTQEQYDAIDDMWEVFRHTYRPCYNHMEHMREIRTEEELLANIHTTAKEIDVAKESVELVAIPTTIISKRFALKKYLGIDIDDVGYKGQEYDDVGMCYAPYIPNLADVGCDIAEVCSNEGKGSLVETLPKDIPSEVNKRTADDILAEISARGDWYAKEQSYNKAMKVVK